MQATSMLSKPAEEEESRVDETQYQWMPSIDVENALLAKRKHLDALESHTKEFPEDLKKQMLARDRQLTELDRRILGLKSQIHTFGEMKEEDKDSEFTEKGKKNKQELEEVASKNDAIKQKMKQTEEKKKKEVTQLQDDKEGITLLQETLSEQLEEVTKFSRSKDRELKEVQTDLNELNGIVNKLVALNKELHGKLRNQHLEIEATNRKYYDAQLKVQGLDSLEERLKTYSQTATEQSATIEHLNRSLAQGPLPAVRETLKQLIESSSEFIGLVRNLNHDSLERNVPRIKGVLGQITELSETGQVALKDASPDSNDRTAIAKLRETEQTLKSAEAFSKKFKGLEQALKSEIKGLKQVIDKKGKEHSDNIEKIGTKADGFWEQIHKVRDRLGQMRTQNEKREIEYAKTGVKVSHLSERIEVLQKRHKEFTANEERLKNSVNKLKEKMKGFVEEKTNAGANVKQKENKLSKVMEQAQILREELFKRDTEVIKKIREISFFEQTCEKLKVSLKNAQDENKRLEENVMGDIKKTIEDKDKEIEMLRGMLETSKKDLKAKDVDIATLNKQITQKRRK